MLGSSSIEINGEIYEFTYGDESYPEMIHIAPMMDEMHCRVRGVDHAPNLTNVLLNVDEHEKEYLLSRHSEKLAMALGLVNTNQGMSIRVVKNLRIYFDCHSFAKLVGSVYGYPPGCNMSEVPMSNVGEGMLSVPFDMGGMPLRDADIG
ncbi:hypothetical protein REPUB_Repub08aG0123700 [Reevesia pubescens]